MDFPPLRGGIQTMAREFVTRASQTELHVIAPADPGSEKFDATLDVEVQRVRAITPGRRGFVPTIALAARARIKRRRPDVVLALHVLAAPGALWAGVPTVVVAHAGEFRSKKIRAVARRVLPRATRVVANSAYTRSAAIAVGADPMRTTVIPVGAPDPVVVDEAAVAALRARVGGTHVVLSVSRLEPHKGQDALIRALPRLDAATHLVIVGDGSDRARLEHVAREAGVAERVCFAGTVGDDELPVYYRAADAFALLSRATGTGVEGGGIVLLEACAYGLPVVAAATGGIPETIHEGETGLLVRPDDPEAVARALQRVLTDAALAEKLRTNARALASGERSWGAFVDRLESVLHAARGGAEEHR